MRQEAYKLFGVDLTQVPGLMLMVMTLFSEIGRDMSRWPTAAHFASWLGLCPDNDISGGRVLWKGMRGCAHNLATDKPQILLSLPFLAGSHCHAV